MKNNKIQNNNNGKEFKKLGFLNKGPVLSSIAQNKGIVLISLSLVCIIIIAVVLGVVFANKNSSSNSGGSTAVKDSKTILTSFINNKNKGVNIAGASLFNHAFNDDDKSVLSGDTKTTFDASTLKVASLNFADYNKNYKGIDVNAINKAINDAINNIAKTGTLPNLDSVTKLAPKNIFASWITELNKNHLYLMEATDSVTKAASNLGDSPVIVPLSVIYLYDSTNKAIYFLNFDVFNGVNFSLDFKTEIPGLKPRESKINMNLNNFFANQIPTNSLNDDPTPKPVANPLLTTNLVIDINAKSKSVNVALDSVFNKNFADSIAPYDADYIASGDNANAKDLFGVIPASSDKDTHGALTATNAANIKAPLKIWTDMNGYSNYFFAENAPNSNLNSNSPADGVKIDDSYSTTLSSFVNANGSNYFNFSNDKDSKKNIFDMSKINFANGGIFAKQTFYNLYVSAGATNATDDSQYFDISDILNAAASWAQPLTIDFTKSLADNTQAIAKNIIAGATSKDNKNASNNTKDLTTGLTMDDSKSGKTKADNTNSTYFFNPGIVNFGYSATSTPTDPAKFVMGTVDLDNKTVSTNALGQHLVVSTSKTNPYFTGSLYNQVIKMKKTDLTSDKNYGMNAALVTNTTDVISADTPGKLDTSKFAVAAAPISLFGPLGKNFFEINIIANANDDSLNFDNVTWNLVDPASSIK